MHQQERLECRWNAVERLVMMTGGRGLPNIGEYSTMLTGPDASNCVLELDIKDQKKLIKTFREAIVRCACMYAS